MIGQTISHFRIVRKLGTGATSVVYVAEDLVLTRQVAFKILTAEQDRQQFHQRMLREARVISSLSHKNIATVYECGETPEGQPYIVMELIKGQTLVDVMRGGTLTLVRLLEIVEQIAEGLAEAHRHRIIHRDIKPSNVALTEQGEVKILDFGLAKQLSEPEGGGAGNIEGAHLLTTQTREGVIVGTPMYLSPEQALGVQVDGRSDIFSLGSLLYECIAGRPAFEGRSAIEVCARVIRDDPPSPSKVNPDAPTDLDRVTLKALAKKPEDRYQRAEELLEDLRAVRKRLEKSHPAPLIPVPVHPEPVRPSLLTTLADTLRRPRLLAAVFVSTLAVALLIFFAANGLLGGKGQPAPTWYEKGVSSLYDGAYYTAAKRFEEAVRSDPGHVLSHARLAEAYMELDKVGRANDEILIANTQTSRAKLTATDALYLDAITSTVKRNFADAINLYAKIAEQSPAEGKSPAYMDLGRAYERDEKIESAIDSYTKAMQTNPRAPAPLLRLGVLRGRKQELPQAEEAFTRALEVYQSLSDQEGRAEVFYQRGVLLIKLRKMAEAREQLRNALDITSITDNLYQRIRILLQLSIASYGLENSADAEQYVATALDLAQANNNENLTVQSLNDLGNFCFVRGKISEAEKYFTRALELSEKVDARRNAARARLSLGSLYVQQDNPAAGVPHIEQALRFYEQGGYRKEVMQGLTLLGQANDLRGEYASALQAFQRLLQLAEDVNDQSQVALSHKGLSTVLMHQEKYADALRNVERSYAIYSSLDDKLNAGYSLVSRADVFWRLGHFDEARAALNQASAIADQPGGAYASLWGRLRIVRAYVELGQRHIPEAIAEGRQAIALDDSKTRHPAIEAMIIVGTAEALSGAKHAGIRTCEEAVKLASGTGDPRLVSGADLALAEARLENGEFREALPAALRAQELASHAGQKESEWRALLFAGRASFDANDKRLARDYLARADGLLSSLQPALEDDYQNYLRRPDVRRYREQLVKTSSAVQ